MSWTDQKPHVVTEKHLKLPWNGAKNGRRFRCYLCGHRFQVGDTFRWVFYRGKYVNFITCSECDGPDVRERWKAANEEARRRFWWAFEDLEDAHREISHEGRVAFDAGREEGFEEGRREAREEERWR